MAEHHVPFNVQELMRIAAAAVGRERCTEIIKLAEGGFNKILLLTMEDESAVIARLPTPIAGPAHYTTASEVATMDFLRNTIGLPVPKVFAWSSRVDARNTVGAEYIIMEKIQGQSLASRWASLSKKELVQVMKNVAAMENRLFSADLPKYGSLYYKDDLDKDDLDRGAFGEKSQVQNEADEPLFGKFIVGPSADRSFWAGERKEMSIDRGPWTKAEDYLTAASRREAAWTTRYGQARRREYFFSVSKEKIDPRDHIALLSQYDRIAPHLIMEQGELTRPTLRHPDLSFSNIFLKPQSTEISSIIDWQGTSVLPLMLQSGYPIFCENDMSQTQSLAAPQISKGFDKMNADEQEAALLDLKLRQANLYYLAATAQKCPRHFQALRLPYLGMRQYLVRQSGMPWDGDLVNLRAALVGVERDWVGLVAEGECPISFTAEERRIAREERDEWNAAADVLTRAKQSIGIDDEGGTAPDSYEWAMAMNAECRLRMVQQTDADEKAEMWRIWPYKDDDDDSPPPLDV